jgi:hypothetical protein
MNLQRGRINLDQGSDESACVPDLLEPAAVVLFLSRAVPERGRTKNK